MDCLSGCIRMTNIPVLVSDSLFASGLWSGIRAGSGSNPNLERDPPSGSKSPSEPEGIRKRRQILVVEDNRADLYLIRQSVEMARVDADLHVVQDGEKAIRFLEQADRDGSAQPPDLVILDINLPKRSGREVARRIRESATCGKAMVVVVTSSDSERDREEMGKFGINAYFRKPSEYDGFMKLGELVKGLFSEGTPAD